MKKSASGPFLLSALVAAALVGAVMATSALAIPAPVTPSMANNNTPYLKASDQLVILAEEAMVGNAPYDALSYLEQAIVANPQNVLAYVILGRVHEDLGSLASGLKYYAIALSIDPFNLQALEADALAKIASGDGEAAAENLERIRRICAEETCAEAERVDGAIEALRAKQS